MGNRSKAATREQEVLRNRNRARILAQEAVKAGEYKAKAAKLEGDLVKEIASLLRGVDIDEIINANAAEAEANDQKLSPAEMPEPPMVAKARMELERLEMQKESERFCIECNKQEKEGNRLALQKLADILVNKHRVAAHNVALKLSGQVADFAADTVKFHAERINEIAGAEVALRQAAEALGVALEIPTEVFAGHSTFNLDGSCR